MITTEASGKIAHLTKNSCDRVKAITGVFELFVTKTTPGYARGIKKLIAREEVDKKKAP